VVVLSNGPPLAGVVIFRSGDSGQGVTTLHHVRMCMVWRVKIDSLDLLFQAVILAQAHREHGAQRNAFRTKKREALFYAFHYALEAITTGLARPVPCHVGAGKTLLSPHKAEDWRRVSFFVDLDELIKLVGLSRDWSCSCSRSVFRSIKEQVQGHGFRLSTHELKNGLVQARYGNFRNLCALAQRVLRGIELDGKWSSVHAPVWLQPL